MDLRRTSFVLSGVAFVAFSAACSGPQQATTTTSLVTSASPAPPATPTTSPTPSPPSTTTATSPLGIAADQCTTSQLTLTAGKPVSEPTGQHSLLLVLTNHSPIACYMSGYPGVTLYDASGAELPLKYYWQGDQVVTHSPPQRVDLASGISAYVMINKYRCDLQTASEATTLRLIPPNDISPLQLSLAGLRELGYCGPGDPGSTLEISPVEPTIGATRAL